MGFLDELKKLTRPYDDDDDEFEDFTPKAPEKIPVTTKASSPALGRSTYGGFDDKREGNKVVNIHATTQLQVVLVKPERFENAADIADHLREKHYRGPQP